MEAVEAVKEKKVEEKRTEETKAEEKWKRGLREEAVMATPPVQRYHFEHRRPQ